MDRYKINCYSSDKPRYVCQAHGRKSKFEYFTRQSSYQIIAPFSLEQRMRSCLLAELTHVLQFLAVNGLQHCAREKCQPRFFGKNVMGKKYISSLLMNRKNLIDQANQSSFPLYNLKLLILTITSIIL